MFRNRIACSLIVAGFAASAACGGKKAPVAAPTTPPTFPGSVTSPGGGTTTTTRPPTPPDPVVTTPPRPADPAVSADPYMTKTPDEINQQSPLLPVFFAYDSAEVDEVGRKVLAENAQLLKKYATWVISVEGHCDERGTAEYNLALGDRRALAAKSYLLSLGVGADRVRTVSYGKEFPFDPGHEEGAWTQNRRAHFMVTSK